MDIPVALQAITTAIGIAKDLREIDKGVDDASFKLKIADLTTSLAEAKITLVAVEEELREKDREIARLKEVFEFRGSTVMVRGYRYEDRGDGTPQGKAFCPRCEQKDGFLIRLTSKSGLVEFQCPECKSIYKDPQSFTYPD